jgi:hypothetical protein
LRIPRGGARVFVGYIVHHNINTNTSSVYPKEEMMANITKMNTNPSSGYPKEEMMDNITNMNTNRSSGYPKDEASLGYPEERFVFI